MSIKQRKSHLHASAKMYILATIATSVLVTDPRRMGWGGVQIPWIKYVSIELVALSIFLGIFVRNPDGQSFSRMEYALGVLFLWMLGGSLYTVVVGGNDFMHSWLGRAINMLPFFAAYRIFSQRSLWAKVTRLLGWIILTTFWIMAGITLLYISGIAWQDLSQVYHAEAVLIFAVATTEYIVNRGIKRLWWAGVFLAISLALILVGKFSTYVFITVAAVSILAYEFYKYDARKAVGGFNRLSLRILQVGLTLALLAFAMVLTRNIVYARIDNSTPVREQTFSERSAMWLNSPIVGTGFIGSPVLTIGSLLIPSHSDWLDLVAFGGVLGGMLLVLPLGEYIWKTWKSIPEISRYPLFLQRIIVFSTIYLVMMAVSMTVNPSLGVPYLSFWFWASVGVLAALFKQIGEM